MKKILSLLLALAFTSTNISSAFAVNSVLPGGEDTASYYLTESQCAIVVDQFTREYEENGLEGMPEELDISDGTDSYSVTKEDVFSCGIKSGNIKFWMIPFFVRDILQWLLALSGLVAVLMVIIGGYYYIIGGLTEDKEKGKNIITYALGGMALATLSWIIVNLILLAVTS